MMRNLSSDGYRIQLILKANIPYSTSYVAVKGINLDGTIPIITSTSTPPPTTTQSSEDEFTTQPPCITEEAEIFPDILDFLDDYEEEDNRADLYRESEDQYDIEKLKNGYTKVMDPYICRSRKPKKMKFR
ncbi:unnamed protein product [Larinioides sclopetarius]|uniref:Uncharacterized protein n=1 Tax=Larinioides sclopetarius TaxID=280406 RepID=A0AAV2BCF5_9ARAC